MDLIARLRAYARDQRLHKHAAEHLTVLWLTRATPRTHTRSAMIAGNFAERARTHDANAREAEALIKELEAVA